MPKYAVFMHNRVLKAIKELSDQNARDRVKEAIEKLGDYPLSLKELDVQKLEGIERTFRVRIGQYRLISHVDKKERVVFVTHFGKRESIYEG